MNDNIIFQFPLFLIFIKSINLKLFMRELRNITQYKSDYARGDLELEYTLVVYRRQINI